MLTFALVTLVFFGQSSYQVGEEDTFLYDVFPPGFQWGFASSSYQVGTHLFNLGGGGGLVIPKFVKINTFLIRSGDLFFEILGKKLI